MLRVGWKVLLSVGLLLSAPVMADDEQSSAADSEPLPAETLSVDELIARFGYGSRWRWYYPTDAADYSADWSQPIADFEFQDGSAYGRVSRIRNLSLVTFTEIGDKQLFLGVNEDGFVGLHLRAAEKVSGLFFWK